MARPSTCWLLIVASAAVGPCACSRVPPDVQRASCVEEAEARAESVVVAALRDPRTDREVLRGAAALAGVRESRVPVRWVEYQLDVSSSAPAGVAGHAVARLVHAETDPMGRAGAELTPGSRHRLFVVKRDGIFWILGWDDRVTSGHQGPGAARFFPAGTFSADTAWDGFRGERYESAFRAVREGALHGAAAAAQEPAAEVYRLLWLRAFEPEVLVRLEIDDVGAGRWVRRWALGRDCTGLFFDETSGEVTPEETRAFRAAMAASSFWATPTPAGPAKVSEEEWVLEATASGRHHLVTRWGRFEGELDAAAAELLAVAQVRPEDVRARRRARRLAPPPPMSVR